MKELNKQIAQKKKELEFLENELKKEQESEKLKEFQSFKLGNKEIKVYKWENKPFKDFPMPKGFGWCEYFDFVGLINEKEKELEKSPVYYYTKNQFKMNIKNGWGLSRFYLDGGLSASSNNVSLAGSIGGGRVVVSRVVK